MPKKEYKVKGMSAGNHHAGGRKEMTVFGRPVPRLDMDTVVRLAEEVASGHNLTQLCKREGYPNINTVYRWMLLYPSVKELMETARELSAMALEDKALIHADNMGEDKELTSNRIKALNSAMGQYRWSAEKRDPNKFAPRPHPGVVVPIQINTTLDMGTGTMGSQMPDGSSVYDLELEAKPHSLVEDLKKDAMMPKAPEARKKHPKSKAPALKTARQILTRALKKGDPVLIEAARKGLEKAENEL